MSRGQRAPQKKGSKKNMLKYRMITERIEDIVRELNMGYSNIFIQKELARLHGMIYAMGYTVMFTPTEYDFYLDIEELIFDELEEMGIY
jgi:hypothetical protein